MPMYVFKVFKDDEDQLIVADCFIEAVRSWKSIQGDETEEPDSVEVVGEVANADALSGGWRRRP